MGKVIPFGKTDRPYISVVNPDEITSVFQCSKCSRVIHIQGMNKDIRSACSECGAVDGITFIGYGIN
ncbi:hypothetical protein P4S95_22895 [Aneurinibacillus aneurinilyticus]|uniref:hypothetical protein n=1 Tax=Aneurinibacillus aneurinilyticus TaxID=1391 RepID=UPI002E1F01CD|nr:hypothetical protein [Aneurinibacillus aneurinilyticus]